MLKIFLYPAAGIKLFKRGVYIMVKKVKEKVRKMTEQDYNNYVMALKDENPVKTIIPEEDTEK